MTPPQSLSDVLPSRDVPCRHPGCDAAVDEPCTTRIGMPTSRVHHVRAQDALAKQKGPA